MISTGPGATLSKPLRRLVATVFLAALALVIAGNSVLNGYLRHGPETIIFTLMLWPVGIACGVAYAVISPARLVVRVLVVLAGLATPYLVARVEPVTARLLPWIDRQESAAAARREEAHFAFLTKYMSEPRSVILASFPFVVVEGGYSLELYDARIRPENRDSVERYFAASLAGRRVTATFPPDFIARYTSHMRRGTTDRYARGPSAGYGDAPAEVVLDGVVLNREINRRWGYPPHR